MDGSVGCLMLDAHRLLSPICQCLPDVICSIMERIFSDINIQICFSDLTIECTRFDCFSILNYCKTIQKDGIEARDFRGYSNLLLHLGAKIETSINQAGSRCLPLEMSHTFTGVDYL